TASSMRGPCAGMPPGTVNAVGFGPSVVGVDANTTESPTCKRVTSWSIAPKIRLLHASAIESDAAVAGEYAIVTDTGPRGGPATVRRRISVRTPETSNSTIRVEIGRA